MKIDTIICICNIGWERGITVFMYLQTIYIFQQNKKQFC